MDDTQILLLTTVAEQSRAKAALEKEIAVAQASEVLRQDGAPKWSDPVWDVDQLVDRSSAASARCLLIFRSVKKKGGPNLVEVYPVYWANIVKLIVVRKIHERFDKGEKFTGGSIKLCVNFTRGLVDSLRANGVECLTEVTRNQIYVALKECGENDSYQCMLRNIVSILVECGATPQLSGIELKGKTRSSRRTAPSNVKPTSWNDMVALATAYQMLQSDQSPYRERNDFDLLRVNMAMANLLACAPSRMSELWRLPFDTAILTNPLQDPEFNATVPEEERDALDFKFAMVWYPVKGGKPVIKPVPNAMQFVAQRCLEILNDYSEKPRKVAKWIMDNPGVMPIPDELKELRAYRNVENARIHTDEIIALLGTNNLRQNTIWKKMFKRTRVTKKPSRTQRHKVTYCFKTLQEEWWEVFQIKFTQAFKADWPFVVNSTTLQLKADRALLLFFSGLLEPRDWNVSQLFFATPTPGGLDSFLGRTNDAVNRTIWDRLDIRLPGGEAPNINTHEIRHFLNTMAQRAGLPQAVIAMWSGRNNIAQNATYDHRTDTERLRAHGYEVSDYDEMQVDDLLNRQVEQLYTGSIGLPSIEVLSAPEGDIRALAKRRIVSITQYGYCVGDLHSDPCPKAVNCLSCARLVTCKGAENATVFIEQKIKLLEAQKATLELHVKEDDGWRLGSDQILSRLEEQIAGAKDMVMTLRDPNLPDGSLVAMGDYRGAQTGSLADRAKTLIAQRKALEAQQKEVPNAEA